MGWMGVLMGESLGVEVADMVIVTRGAEDVCEGIARIAEEDGDVVVKQGWLALPIRWAEFNSPFPLPRASPK